MTFEPEKRNTVKTPPEKKRKPIQPKPVEEGVPEVKPKPKPEKTVNPIFPADAKINDYGFLGFKTGWLADLGWTKGMPLKIEKNADGSITLRKA